MQNKYMSIPFSKVSPVRVVAGLLIRPTRLDTVRDIVHNGHGLYTPDEVRRAKRILIKETY